MFGNTFGQLFRVMTFGESHGTALGVVIDGCPAGLPLDLEAIQQQLDRRRPGQSSLVTQRQESDTAELLSGVFEGVTTGTPLAFIVHNQDQRSKDYGSIKDLFRPGHADFTYFAKYGVRDYRGGGRSSARETVSRVIAGAVARQLLATTGVAVKAGLIQVGTVKVARYDWAQVEDNELRSVDPDAVEPMRQAIEIARKSRDSIGGVVEVVAEGVSPGWGEPVFGRLDALIAGALMSLPAAKAVEIGEGFAAASTPGSVYHDEMTPEGFLSNNHGGVLGGISTGAPVVARVTFKPTSSLPQHCRTIDKDFSPAEVITRGRHDPCVALRAVPIVEAMMSLVLVDLWLQHAAQVSLREGFSPLRRINYGLV